MSIRLGCREQWQNDEQRWSHWMAEANQGNRAVYEQLLSELATTIETYLRVRFGGIDSLEDILQECLLAIHRARHTYSPHRAFRPWLFTVVRNRSIDILRQRQLHWRTFDTEICIDQHCPASVSHDPGLPMDLRRSLAGLHPDHREALLLTKFAGYTVAEAAIWAGISKTAMKLRVFRALIAARKQLERDGFCHE